MEKYRTGFVSISQRDLDVFAALTDNYDPLHNDSEWASTRSPAGATLVHGMLVASFVPRWFRQLPPVEAFALNGTGLFAGIDRLRWLLPIPVDARFCAEIEALHTPNGDTGKQNKKSFAVKVFQEGHESPSMVLEAHFVILAPDTPGTRIE